MKTILLIFTLLLASVAHAAPCQKTIAKSAVTLAISGDPKAFWSACSLSDPCICFDGIDWTTASWDGSSLTSDPTKSAAKTARKNVMKNLSAITDAPTKSVLMAIIKELNLDQ